MKQIIGCFLSFILLLQTTVYSQTMYPTKQQVAEIYQKVYNRVNSSNIFKDFSSDNQITPLLALEIIASDVQIKNQQDLADWLQKFDIPIRPDASVVDIYNEVYSRFQTERFANDIGIESIDKQYHDAAVFLNMINKKDPTILPNCDEYLRTIKELDIEYEAENLGIEQASACTERYLENIENLFAESCKRVNVNPIVVINAYVNYTQIPDLVQSTVDEENLLSNFTRKLSVLKGWYLGWRELTATKGEEKALSAIVKK